MLAKVVGGKRMPDIALRYRMRDAAQALTSARGVEHCGRRLANPLREGSVSLRVHAATGKPGFGNLGRCNSVWECPVCAPRIQAQRSEDLRALNDAHLDVGGAMYMATLTLPHYEGDALKPLRVNCAKAWTAIKTGAPWRRWKDRLQLVGEVRALETTHGENGWHPHVHVALYLVRSIDEGTLEDFERWLYARWCAVLQRRSAAAGRTYRMPTAENGVVVTPLRSSDYLAKMGLAAETASSWTKEGRTGHRTPFQILRDIALGVDVERRRADVTIWRQWARGIRGARQLVYSRGLRERYGLREPVPDEQITDDAPELDGFGAKDHETVYTFAPDEWKALFYREDDDGRFVRVSVRYRIQLLAVPLRFPRDEWHEQVLRILDAARGLAPVPF